MSHWQLLDLTEDADERSIKRAYARLLKAHRPDEDPEGFQRLREAYDASLAEARWRAEMGEALADAPAALASSPLQHAPEQQASVLPAQADTPVVSPALEWEQAPAASAPPEPSLAQMQQWLAAGKDRQVLEAVRVWLASDWLLPFERRQRFEHQVLEWLESSSHWSPAFFDAVCTAMGWDETQGALPCEYWRWGELTGRCEALALGDHLVAQIADFDADGSRGRAAALLLKPMSDRRRRRLADRFGSDDWQRFSQLAQTIEYQYPTVPDQTGLQPLSNWRDWLPAESYRGVYLFLWLTLSTLWVVTTLAWRVDNRLGAVIVLPLLMPVLLWGGMKAYQAWHWLAVVAAPLDIALSRTALPARWYRQGAGLLLLRHMLPAAVPTALAYVWSQDIPGLKWISPLVVCAGAWYFTHLALRGGKPSIWARTSMALKRKLARLPWHWLQREAAVAIVAVLGMGALVYLRMKYTL